MQQRDQRSWWRTSIWWVLLFGVVGTACGEVRFPGPVPPRNPQPEHPSSPDRGQAPKRDADQGAAPGPVKVELVERSDGPRLRLRVDGREIVRPEGPALYSSSSCRVTVEKESWEEGALLHFTIANLTESSQEMPELLIGGIQMDRQRIELLENWKHVHFKEPLESRDHHQLHALRSYPAQIYSPVLGMRNESVFLGSSVIYDVFTVRREVNLDYRWDRRNNSWTKHVRFWDDLPDRSGDRPSAPPVARLDPNEEIRVTLAVGAAAPDQWVHAFRPYRDEFRDRYGEVRYQRSTEPIYAISLGTMALISDDNPRGYNRWGAGGLGRMDAEGWRGLRQRANREIFPKGYRRVLFWQVSGSYRKHRAQNMVWEITSAWPEAMENTADDLVAAIEGGLTVGLWWGRASQISGGFDSGERTAWDPDREEHNQAVFGELDRAYELGVRLIGLDATSSAIGGRSDARPRSDVLFERIMPMLYERYPEMQWIIEPAPCDYLHLWGASFLWSRDVGESNAFAEYLVPGHETNPVFKRDRPHPDLDRQDAHMVRERVENMIRAGMTPMVYNADRYGLAIDRDLIAEPE